jgi:hypothetical protein
MLSSRRPLQRCRLLGVLFYFWNEGWRPQTKDIHQIKQPSKWIKYQTIIISSFDVTWYNAVRYWRVNRAKELRALESTLPCRPQWAKIHRRAAFGQLCLLGFTDFTNESLQLSGRNVCQLVWLQKMESPYCRQVQVPTPSNLIQHPEVLSTRAAPS